MDPLLRSLKEEIRSFQDNTCLRCKGMGMLVLEDDAGHRYAEQCECVSILRALRAIERANIPTRYESCTFATFDSVPGMDQSIGMSSLKLQEFVKSWPLDQNGTGLLITGPIGVGKTHLAVATLRALISEYNAVGLFCDHRALLKALQNTYSSRTPESERDILTPVFRADVLVIDELGREARSEWTSEMMEHILNTRYNDRKTTIITTNYANKVSILSRRDKSKDEALGDRVGDRIFSRIQEMCVVVNVQGDDFRKAHPAQLGW